MPKPDPTKERKFQQVVQTFLRTPPQPHKPVKKARAKNAKARKK